MTTHEPITFTLEEACSAVADVFEAIPGTWTNDDMELDSDKCKWCVVTGVKCALKAELEFPADAHKLLFGVARDLGYQNISGANHSREDGIKLLRIAAGELPMPKGKDRP